MNTEVQHKQDGFVLVVVAVLLVVLIAFVALAVDVGVLYSAKTSAQSVADAAALAGAGTFILDPLATDHNATATAAAMGMATQGSILGVPVTDVNVVSDWDIRRVTVTVNTSQSTYFAKVFSPSNVPVGAVAIAEASTNATSASGVKPFFVPNTLFAPAGETACPACAAGHVLFNTDGTINHSFTDTKIGTSFVLKSGTPSQAIGPGEFYALQFPGSNGSNDFSNNVATPNPTPINCKDSYSVETGNMVGPTKQGIDDLIGVPPTDTWGGIPGQYQTSHGLSDISKNLVLLPVWDSCNTMGFCPTGKFGSGTNVQLKVIGFALAFVDNITGNDVNARLVNVTACGGGTGGGGGGGAGDSGSSVLSVPLRLVRLP